MLKLDPSTLRIGFIVLRFLKECSGNLESLLNLMKGLKTLGCQCTLMTPRTSSIADRFADFPVIQFSDIPLSDFRILTIQKALTIASINFHNHFDLLQLQLPSPAFMSIAGKIRTVSSLPVIACPESSLHSSFPVPLPRDYRTLGSVMIRRLINNRFFARFSQYNVDACVVSSQYQRDELMSLKCKAPIHVISNSTDFERYSLSENKNNLDISLPHGKSIICYLGHFNFVKGVKYFLAAFRILMKRRDDIHMLLIGSGRGNHGSEIKKEAKRLGPAWVSLIEREVDVPSMLHSISILVLPYVASFGQQIFPNLVLEALASGTPIITSDIPPINEIIEDGKTGYLVKPGDERKLAEKIENVLKLKNENEEMKIHQQHICRKYFDYKIIANKYLSLFEEFVHG